MGTPAPSSARKRISSTWTSAARQRCDPSGGARKTMNKRGREDPVHQQRRPRGGRDVCTGCRPACRRRDAGSAAVGPLVYVQPSRGRRSALWFSTFDGRGSAMNARPPVGPESIGRPGQAAAGRGPSAGTLSPAHQAAGERRFPADRERSPCTCGCLAQAAVEPTSAAPLHRHSPATCRVGVDEAPGQQVGRTPVAKSRGGAAKVS